MYVEARITIGVNWSLNRVRLAPVLMLRQSGTQQERWGVPMRATLLLLFLLAGCQQDFDTQYSETEKKVKAAEARLDAEMAKEAAKEPGEDAKKK